MRITCNESLIPEPHAHLILHQLDASLVDTIERPRGDSADWSSLESCLLSHIPAKEPTLPSNVTLLHQFVERHAREQPQKVALEWVTAFRATSIDKTSWTYGELDIMGNKIAHLIQRHGIPPNSMVGVSFDKGPEASFAILGILKSGCAFLALDPDAPLERKAFMLKDSKTKLILTTKKGCERLQGLSSAISIAVDECDVLDGLSSTPVQFEHGIAPDDDCYCLYTSGTLV